ncbi:MAG: ribonuclease III [Deltaproteobacteria bacterium]|nr:ribonuclease III [Deltaproteobacteria bacterium]
MTTGPEKDTLDGLESRISYQFTDRELLAEAVTHPSRAGETNASSNQRLEFLGDAVLDLMLAQELLLQHPSWDEGRLSRSRASLVSGRALASLAAELSLGDWVRLGRGESTADGSIAPSILANAYEALMGAVFLDGGYDAARQVVAAHFAGRLDEVTSSDRDSKTALQELTQKNYAELPTYETIKVSGPDHARVYEVEVFVQARSMANGSGRSRRAAEQEAAEHALERLSRES